MNRLHLSCFILLNSGKKKFFTGNCSHFRAYYYFAESIQNPTGFRATGIRSSNLKALDQSFEIFMGGPVVDRQ